MLTNFVPYMLYTAYCIKKTFININQHTVHFVYLISIFYSYLKSFISILDLFFYLISIINSNRQGLGSILDLFIWFQTLISIFTAFNFNVILIYPFFHVFIWTFNSND